MNIFKLMAVASVLTAAPLWAQTAAPSAGETKIRDEARTEWKALVQEERKEMQALREKIRAERKAVREKYSAKKQELRRKYRAERQESRRQAKPAAAPQAAPAEQKQP
ncbi:MAG: hypothetical protein PHF00_00350 [Elusimicrobia bacterium]|nr:hypothetical protein [Elusimicrobiota bacterium]